MRHFYYTSLFVVASLIAIGCSSSAPLQDSPQVVNGATVLEEVEQPPEIVGALGGPGGMRYPASARRAGVEGTVRVQFVVLPDGTTTDAKVVRGVHPALDHEAERVVLATTFSPGMHEGEAVPVRMTHPVAFRLSD